MEKMDKGLTPSEIVEIALAKQRIQNVVNTQKYVLAMLNIYDIDINAFIKGTVLFIAKLLRDANITKEEYSSIFEQAWELSEALIKINLTEVNKDAVP